MVAMAAIGLWGLDRGSMWRDEAATYVAARRTVPQLWFMVHNVDAVHGLYYLGMHVWTAAAGGDVWMRVPSVLASVVSAGLVAALGTRLSGVGVGLSAGILFAASPFVSFYAQEARPFALVSAWVLASTYFLVLAMARGAAWWVAYAVAVTVASLTNELALLTLLAHAVTLWVHRSERRIWWRWSGCAAVCAAAVAPLVAVSSAQSGQVAWLQRSSLTTLGDLAELFLGRGRLPMAVAVVLLLAGLAAIRSRSGLELAAVATPLAFVSTVVLLATSFVHPLFHPRYVLYAQAGVSLLTALGLVRLASMLGRRRWLTGVITGVVLLTSVAPQVPELRFVRTPASRSDDLTAAAEAVRRNAGPGDAVVYVPGFYRLTALRYPQAFAGLDDVALQAGPVETGSLTGQDKDVVATSDAMLAVDRLWVIGRPGLVVYPGEPKSLAKRTILATHFRRVRAIEVQGLEVALYARRG
jgi:mannosyltransferase